jgi:uncharacterized membrane protein
MYAFGVDMPLVELLIGIVIVSVIILIEITVVLVMLMYKLRTFKRLHDDSRDLAKTLLRIKELESHKKK